jgi:Ca-activated chloride channel family protein
VRFLTAAGAPLASILALIAGIGLPAEPPQPAFKTGVQTVAIHATVSDAEGRLVPDLPRERFQVLDDGKPVEITTFSNDDQPLTAALLLDMSSSMYPSLLRVRESTLQFINALRDGDRVRIGTFGDEIALSPLLTGDKAVLTRIAREELWPGGSTPLWGALYGAMGSLEKETGRRVVVVLSDGMNAGSVPGWPGSFGSVRKRATRDGYMLYVIGMEGMYQNDEAANNFKRLIEDTGGGHFVVRAGDDLRQTFVRVVEELRRQYLLGFTPAADGRTHKLEVRVSGDGLRARARASYVAERRSP